jgi:hypothetical protein
MPKLLFARPPRDATDEAQVRRLAASRHAPGDWIRRAQMVERSWAGWKTTRIAAALRCHLQKVRERSREAQRLQATLEGGNVKLTAVATDVTGKSAHRVLEALVAGTGDATGAPAAAAQAELAEGRLRAKRPRLEQALAGHFGAHQRFLVAEHLAAIDLLEETIDRLSAEIAARLASLEPVLARLDAVPGIGRRTAEVLAVDVGPDVGRFPSAKHLASWAGLCTGNHQSAGKRQSGRTRKANPRLRAALAEAAQAATRASLPRARPLDDPCDNERRPSGIGRVRLSRGRRTSCRTSRSPTRSCTTRSTGRATRWCWRTASPAPARGGPTWPRPSPSATA